MWTSEQAIAAATSKGGLVTIASLLSGASGTAVGYFLAKRKLENRYIAISNREIAEARRFYRRLNKVDEFATPADVVDAVGLIAEPELVDKAADALLEYQGEDPDNDAVDDRMESRRNKEDTAHFTVRDNGTIVQHVPTVTNYTGYGIRKPSLEETVALNVFMSGDEEDPDVEGEKAKRDEEFPYIITQGEFLENEPEHDQLTVTFYEEDDVLADDKDTPISDTEGTIGIDTLKFGMWSKDNNVVYIRNHRLGTDFEVLRSTGSFAKEVLGFQHSSDRPVVRKMRPRDD